MTNARRRSSRRAVFYCLERELKAYIGHKNLPILYDSRPAGAPALQWNSAFCSAGAPAGTKTNNLEFVFIRVLIATL